MRTLFNRSEARWGCVCVYFWCESVCGNCVYVSNAVNSTTVQFIFPWWIVLIFATVNVMRFDMDWICERLIWTIYTIYKIAHNINAYLTSLWNNIITYKVYHTLLYCARSYQTRSPSLAFNGLIENNIFLAGSSSSASAQLPPHCHSQTAKTTTPSTFHTAPMTTTSSENESDAIESKWVAQWLFV